MHEDSFLSLDSNLVRNRKLDLIMKVLYVGQCNEGSTSKMRYCILQELIASPIELINISNYIESASRIFKSLAWRYNFGPLVHRINIEIEKYLKSSMIEWDLIWVDKGVFIYPQTLLKLKQRTKNLVHYTPDTAFYQNKSSHFLNGINTYDYLITTKSFDLNYYYKLVNNNKIIYKSQGYNSKIHFPRVDFTDKTDTITFVGLCEPSREKIISYLLARGYKMNIGGFGWSNFFEKHKKYLNNINFLGELVINENYAVAISKSKFALGLLSKKFPEMHTTRTFEIPACGTCLITETNSEINSLFNDNECLKFKVFDELDEKLKYYFKNSNSLE